MDRCYSFVPNANFSIYQGSSSHRIIPLVQKSLAAVRLPDALTTTHSSGLAAPSESLDFSALINLRRRHQTRQAALGVRTKQDPSSIQKPETTLRQQLIRQFHEILKEHQQSSQDGEKRNARWRKSDKENGDAESPQNGNSANAAAVAATAIKKVCIFR